MENAILTPNSPHPDVEFPHQIFFFFFFKMETLSLSLFRSTNENGDEDGKSAGWLDGIRPFLSQNGRLPSSCSPARTARNPALSRPKRSNPTAGSWPSGRDPTLSRPDPGRLAEIRPFPGQNSRNPFCRRWEGEGRWRE